MSRLSDTDLLVPAFRERLAGALKALKGQGYSPIVFETLRSKERALELVAKGRSKAKGGLSMHCLGLAADMICGSHQWDCARHHCAFFATLGVCAEDVGLVWGGRWDFVDQPHVQCIPVRLQNKARATAPEHMDAFVKSYFAGLVR